MRFNLLTLVFFLSCVNCRADWVWTKRSVDIDVPISGEFVKTAALDVGKLKCRSGVTTYAWISRRLEPKTKLSRKDGEALGRTLNRALKKSCIEGIELDFEPMPFLSSGFVELCAGLRQVLEKRVKLRVAIPVVSETALVGPSWDEKRALRLLAVVDGIDVMIYDSGIADVQAYHQLVASNARFAIRAKKVVLGFPAYQDKTLLHKASVENLKEVLSALRTLTEEEQYALCYDGIEFSYFASYSMTETDKEAARQLSKWRRDLCRKK